MQKLPKICMSGMFEKRAKIQCSAARHPLLFCSRIKITNCSSFFSVKQLLLRLLVVSSHICFQGCRYLPGKTNRFIAFHLWQCTFTSYHVLLYIATFHSNSTYVIATFHSSFPLGFVVFDLIVTLGTVTSFFSCWIWHCWDSQYFLMSHQCAFTTSYSKWCVTTSFSAFLWITPWIADYFTAEPL